MPIDLTITLAAVFISCALMTGMAASYALSRTSPEIKRLHQKKAMASAAAADGAFGEALADAGASMPLLKSRTDGSRFHRQLAAAGWVSPYAATVYRTCQALLSLLLGTLPLMVFGVSPGWMVALPAALVGFMLPDLLLSRRITQQKRAVQNGLPDALDLLVVCVEAGSSLDQAIYRASEELEIALPSMAHELRTIATEIRAGKPRIEAFQNFAKRTKLDDVRALVSMLIQTDRFGTSIAQALRTHADTLRTKRRQRAEERAGKVGVKLVFPLVLCMLPALYVVCLGPVGVRMYRALF